MGSYRCCGCTILVKTRLNPLDKTYRNMLQVKCLNNRRILTMTACATKKILPEKVIVGNLFLPLPDTDFRGYLDEIEELAKSAPGIIAAIEADLDVHARQEKEIRLEYKKYLASRAADLPKLDIKVWIKSTSITYRDKYHDFFHQISLRPTTPAPHGTGQAAFPHPALRFVIQ